MAAKGRTVSTGAGFDLDGYLERVGYRGPRACTLAVLDAVHEAHVSAIPFENLDVLLGRPIRLDPGSLQAKLVAGGRGGYCFEHNSLLAAALRAMGFSVSTLEARVRPLGATAVLPRTHMVLAIRLGSQDVLADAGFGGDGPLRTVPLDGTESIEPLAGFRVAREDDVYVLRTDVGGAWRDLYAFSRAPALPVDFEVASHYTSTHPTSPFVTTLTAQRTTATARHVLRGRTYTVRTAGGEFTTTLDDVALCATIRGILGIALSAAEILRAFRTTLAS